jgi:hypothetical protein
MREPNLALAFRERLPEIFRRQLQLKLSGVSKPPRSGQEFDVVFELKLDGKRRRLYVETKSRLLRRHYLELEARINRLKEVDSAALALLAIPRLSKRGRERLRRRGINHADLRGTLFIRSPGLFVDLEGTESWSLPPEPSRVNPFSDKASLVLRLMLEEPERTWRVTDLSERVKVTKGWASLVLRELADRRYAVREDAGFRLLDPVEALQDWSTVYEWNQNRVQSYVAPFQRGELLRTLAPLLEAMRAPAALTLLAGADLWAPHVQHEQVHVYVARSGVERFNHEARQRLFLEDSTSGGNFHVVDPFYAHSVFHAMTLKRGMPVVSPVQLFLDLVHFPVRGDEAAAMLVRTTLASQMSLNRRQVANLLKSPR